ncbi:MAG TPA: hypothetical protein VGL93_18090 [Streptosporangiaceae bacterium]|jgi:hypothetical protein
MSLAVAAHAPLALIDLNGTGGTVLLIFYIIGGLALAGTSWLPGNSTGWKIGGTIIGIVIVIWSAVVLLVGGWIPISFYILILPVLGIVRAVRAMAVRRNTPAVSPYGPQAGFAGAPGGYPGPQPGQYGQPDQYGQFPGQQPQFGGPGYQPQPQQSYQAQQPYIPPGTETWGQPQQPPQQPPQPGGWNG